MHQNCSWISTYTNQLQTPLLILHAGLELLICPYFHLEFPIDFLYMTTNTCIWMAPRSHYLVCHHYLQTQREPRRKPLRVQMCTDAEVYHRRRNINVNAIAGIAWTFILICVPFMALTENPHSRGNINVHASCSDRACQQDIRVSKKQISSALPPMSFIVLQSEPPLQIIYPFVALDVWFT